MNAETLLHPRPTPLEEATAAFAVFLDGPRTLHHGRRGGKRGRDKKATAKVSIYK